MAPKKAEVPRDNTKAQEAVDRNYGYRSHGIWQTKKDFFSPKTSFWNKY